VQIVVTLIQGLTEAIPTLIEYIPEILIAIVEAIVAALPLIGEAAVEIIMALIEGVGTMLPRIGEAAIDIITTLGTAIGALGGTIAEVGGNIVRGVWEGIQARAAWFAAQVTAFFQGIIDGVKDLLGIESPSTVFAGIGKNMALGMGGGFGRAFSSIERDIDESIRGMPALNIAGGPAGGQTVEGAKSVTVNATVGSNIDIHTLAVQLRNEFARM
jgi:phage-related protein